MAATTRAEATRWNRQVREVWNAQAAGWERYEAFHMHYLAPVNPMLLRALELAPGQRVLDAACGPGEPALQIARWVEPGKVVGLDIAAPMLEVARRRARALGIRNARFVRGDLSRLPRGLGRFDRVTSRFGLMFVPDVGAALATLHAALRPRGRAAFAVWGPPGRNPFFAFIQKHVGPLMDEMPDPEESPNPFRLMRSGRLAGLMRAAGFRDVRQVGVLAVATYPDGESWYASSIETSSMMRVLLQRLSARERAGLRRRMVADTRRFRSGAALRVPGFAWVVSGRR